MGHMHQLSSTLQQFDANITPNLGTMSSAKSNLSAEISSAVAAYSSAFSGLTSAMANDTQGQSTIAGVKLLTEACEVLQKSIDGDIGRIISECESVAKLIEEIKNKIKEGEALEPGGWVEKVVNFITGLISKEWCANDQAKIDRLNAEIDQLNKAGEAQINAIKGAASGVALGIKGNMVAGGQLGAYVDFNSNYKFDLEKFKEENPAYEASLLGTVGSFYVGQVEGVLNLVEGIVDAVLTPVAAVTSLIDKGLLKNVVKYDVSEFAGDLMAKPLDALGLGVNEKARKTGLLVGEIVGAVAVSAVASPTVGLAMLSMSSGGQASEIALKDGSSIVSAALLGAGTSALTFVMPKFISGVGKAGATVLGKVTSFKPVNKLITSNVVKTATAGVKNVASKAATAVSSGLTKVSNVRVSVPFTKGKVGTTVGKLVTNAAIGPARVTASAVIKNNPGFVAAVGLTRKTGMLIDNSKLGRKLADGRIGKAFGLTPNATPKASTPDAGSKTFTRHKFNDNDNLLHITGADKKTLKDAKIDITGKDSAALKTEIEKAITEKRLDKGLGESLLKDYGITPGGTTVKLTADQENILKGLGIKDPSTLTEKQLKVVVSHGAANGKIDTATARSILTNGKGTFNTGEFKISKPTETLSKEQVEALKKASFDITDLDKQTMTQKEFKQAINDAVKTKGLSSDDADSIIKRMVYDERNKFRQPTVLDVADKARLRTIGINPEDTSKNVFNQLEAAKNAGNITAAEETLLKTKIASTYKNAPTRYVSVSNADDAILKTAGIDANGLDIKTFTNKLDDAVKANKITTEQKNVFLNNIHLGSKMSNSYVSVSSADDAILKTAGINANGMELNSFQDKLDDAVKAGKLTLEQSNSIMKNTNVGSKSYIDTITANPKAPTADELKFADEIFDPNITSNPTEADMKKAIEILQRKNANLPEITPGSEGLLKPSTAPTTAKGVDMYEAADPVMKASDTLLAEPFYKRIFADTDMPINKVNKTGLVTGQILSEDPADFVEDKYQEINLNSNSESAKVLTGMGISYQGKTTAQIENEFTNAVLTHQAAGDESYKTWLASTLSNAGVNTSGMDTKQMKDTLFDLMEKSNISFG